MPHVPFTKMHGIGNDYVYFDCLRNPDLVPDPAAVAPRIADRHFGVGGDGIVLILPGSEAEFRMRMFNADGSEAEMCGNAIRCVGKYLYDYGHVNGSAVQIQTGAGVLSLELEIDSEGESVSAVRVDMGEPILTPADIPVRASANPVLRHALKLPDGRTLALTCVSMGNPHAVAFVPQITDAMVLQDGPEVEVHPDFPSRTNVEFVEVLDRDEVRMRVWERGSGETMACGTGACAVAVAGVLENLTNRAITVHLRGGGLRICWDQATNHVFMTGPATESFTGAVEL